MTLEPTFEKSYQHLEAAHLDGNENFSQVFSLRNLLYEMTEEPTFEKS